MYPSLLMPRADGRHCAILSMYHHVRDDDGRMEANQRQLWENLCLCQDISYRDREEGSFHLTPCFLWKSLANASRSAEVSKAFPYITRIPPGDDERQVLREHSETNPNSLHSGSSHTALFRKVVTWLICRFLSLLGTFFLPPFLRPDLA